MKLKIALVAVVALIAAFAVAMCSRQNTERCAVTRGVEQGPPC